MNEEVNKNFIKNIINKNNNKSLKRKFFEKFKFLNLIFLYLIIYILYFQIHKTREEIKKDNIKLNYSINLLSENDNEFGHIINKYKRDHIVWPLPKEIKFRPIMSELELITFLNFMKPGNIYFEFGSGGSTNIASYFKIKTYSVESDVKWHEKLKINGIIANYITIDLHSTNLGYPGINTNLENWKKYIQAYKKEYNADIILIDGRFRVACALDIFSKIRNDTLILIHDYKNRKQYHILEKYYIKLKVLDTLALFIKNTKIDSIQENIYNYYLKQKFI